MQSFSFSFSSRYLLSDCLQKFIDNLNKLVKEEAQSSDLDQPYNQNQANTASRSENLESG